MADKTLYIHDTPCGDWIAYTEGWIDEQEFCDKVKQEMGVNTSIAPLVVEKRYIALSFHPNYDGQYVYLCDSPAQGRIKVTCANLSNPGER